MDRKEYAYNERQIVIESQDDKHRVTIDGEDIPVKHVKETNEFIAIRHSPYIVHGSLEDMTTHVVDDVINHRHP